ncbi:sulfotransferase family protein [Rubrivirga sp. IMCC45206]|uniref:sulfotransferase family protein n=1 Tax=Rubrivirga sp. IMCC45206 TaxID=3391614 RepID=UPI0039902DCB
MSDTLDRPIVVLGAARSGTTMLATTLAAHPDLAYWVEPKYVWRYGRPLAPDDRRGADEARPRVRRYIRRAFARFTKRAGVPRFMEKTPSNCFRVPFVHAVLPDARFLHVVRDGRAVTRSAVKKWTTPPDPTAIRRRLTSFEIPLRDVPFYVGAGIRDSIGRQLMPEQAFLWGPQFPGIREVRAEHGVEVACAVQWRESVLAARAGLAQIPAAQRYEVRFEDLVADPDGVLPGVLAFLGLGPGEPVLAHARQHFDAAAAHRTGGKALASAPYLQPLLADLGYR